ncbi:hypothetical protein SAMN05216167_14316 [Spirosoma endophyticum]|uniref:Uncharacterized protein n=1 Tax=Spirosoma endophyticum TaxID=662367 RepID=A0A1I2HJB7_9BACT|nr:hypothetical protein SAMN05216167_14316 [Spirosoma endophyticum]
MPQKNPVAVGHEKGPLQQKSPLWQSYDNSCIIKIPPGFKLSIWGYVQLYRVDYPW